MFVNFLLLSFFRSLFWEQQREERQDRYVSKPFFSMLRIAGAFISWELQIQNMAQSLFILLEIGSRRERERELCQQLQTNWVKVNNRFVDAQWVDWIGLPAVSLFLFTLFLTMQASMREKKKSQFRAELGLNKRHFLLTSSAVEMGQAMIGFSFSSRTRHMTHWTTMMMMARLAESCLAFFTLLLRTTFKGWWEDVVIGCLTSNRFCLCVARKRERVQINFFFDSVEWWWSIGILMMMTTMRNLVQNSIHDLSQRVVINGPNLFSDSTRLQLTPPLNYERDAPTG